MDKSKPDGVDWKILRHLQRNARLSNITLARKVGISPPTCLRRVRALQEKGVIKEYHSILNDKALGYEVTVFAMVGLHSQAEVDLRNFEKRVALWAPVRECYMLNGDIDFILKCVTPTLEDFQTFLTKELTPAPNVASVRTALTIRQAKHLPGPPIEDRE